jgi:catechol 2,3-dioxygenase-like lactoylglutathione lyase family enzyme
MRVIVTNYTRFVRAALLLLVPMLLPGADLKIDHVTVAGKDLKAMQATLAALGIPTEYGGPHSNHATEMALTSFPDGSYLELIAIQPNADPAAVAAHYWSKHMQNDAGPSAWAVRPQDFDFEVKRLQARNLAVQPARSGRARPDGVRLEWEAAPVGPGPNGSFFPFLIRDFTPRDQRAYPSGKPTTQDFSGVARVVIAVRNIKAAIARYRRAYDLGVPMRQTDEKFGAHLAYFPGTPIVLAMPVNKDSWLSSRLDKIGEGPCAFILRARNAKSYRVSSQAAWFGTSISWLDTGKTGWWLGFE